MTSALQCVFKRRGKLADTSSLWSIDSMLCLNMHAQWNLQRFLFNSETARFLLVVELDKSDGMNKTPQPSMSTAGREMHPF
jgi:hypothetical protein